MIWLFIAIMWLAVAVALILAYIAWAKAVQGPRERRSILKQRNAVARMDSADWPQW